MCVLAFRFLCKEYRMLIRTEIGTTSGSYVYSPLPHHSQEA